MIKNDQLEHRFVQYVPETLTPGILYISVEYGMASHSCCCGCGEEIVTPFTPTDWKMIFDGETITLHPSIGNWMLPCKSHYWIKKGRVIGAGKWSDDEISLELIRDREAKKRHYCATQSDEITSAESPDGLNLLDRVLSWFKKAKCAVIFFTGFMWFPSTFLP